MVYLVVNALDFLSTDRRFGRSGAGWRMHHFVSCCSPLFRGYSTRA